MVEPTMKLSEIFAERTAAAVDNRREGKNSLSPALQIVLGTAVAAAMTVGIVSGRMNSAYTESASQLNASIASQTPENSYRPGVRNNVTAFPTLAP